MSGNESSSKEFDGFSDGKIMEREASASTAVSSVNATNITQSIVLVGIRAVTSDRYDVFLGNSFPPKVADSSVWSNFLDLGSRRCCFCAILSVSPASGAVFCVKFYFL